MAASYVIVSPVRDEESFVEETIRSVCAQTLRPVKWVIVDDSSLDGTPAILDRYQKDVPWISVVRVEDSAERRPGAVMEAFYAGYALLGGAQYDYIVKLDCDLALPPDYFRRLFAFFDEAPRLGIASGVYLEEDAGRWRPVSMPHYHAAGAAKAIRRECYEDIQGFMRVRGWDTVDEIKAQARGWETRHFSDLQFRHLKPEGASSGWLVTQKFSGEVYYRYRGGKLFLFAKVAYRAVAARPPFLNAGAMLWGYLRMWVRGEPRLVTREEGRVYRQMQYGRLLSRRASGASSEAATG